MNLLAANTRSSIVVLLSAAAALSACAPAETAEQKAQRARAKAGLALWERKCKTEAGEKIYRKVEDVEGITLLKVRPPAGENEWHDRMWPGAAFAREATADGFIESFLGYEEAFGPDGKPRPITPTTRGGINTSFKAGPKEHPGYRFVDVVDSSNGERNRYVIRYDEPWQQDKTWLKGYISAQLDKRPALGPAPRYGVTYEDHVVPEERELGVASSTVKVLDVQTNEVLGELTVYAFTYGFESRGNSAWLRAKLCPAIASGATDTRQFVDQVLVPRKEQ